MILVEIWWMRIIYFCVCASACANLRCLIYMAKSGILANVALGLL